MFRIWIEASCGFICGEQFVCLKVSGVRSYYSVWSWKTKQIIVMPVSSCACIYSASGILYTSINARLRQASLLRRIVEGAEGVRSLFVGVVSDRELLLFSWAFGDQGRDWNALTCHFASEINISEHASSASLVANTAGNSLACFQVLEQRYELSKQSLSNRCAYVATQVFRAYSCSTKSVLHNNNMASPSLCWPCITKSVLRVSWRNHP